MSLNPPRLSAIIGMLLLAAGVASAADVPLRITTFNCEEG